MAKIKVIDNQINIIKVDGEDFISLTDIANSKDGELRAADYHKKLDKKP